MFHSYLRCFLSAHFIDISNKRQNRYSLINSFISSFVRLESRLRVEGGTRSQRRNHGGSHGGPRTPVHEDPVHTHRDGGPQQDCVPAPFAARRRQTLLQGVAGFDGVDETLVGVA